MFFMFCLCIFKFLIMFVILLEFCFMKFHHCLYDFYIGDYASSGGRESGFSTLDYILQHFLKINFGWQLFFWNWEPNVLKCLMVYEKDSLPRQLMPRFEFKNVGFVGGKRGDQRFHRLLCVLVWFVRPSYFI